MRVLKGDMPYSHWYTWKSFSAYRIAILLIPFLMILPFIRGQSIAPVPNVPTAPVTFGFQDFEHLGLEGWLGALVVVLWKTLQAERAAASALLQSERASATALAKTNNDAQIEATRATVAALTTSSSSNAELRRIIEESANSSREVAFGMKEICKVIAQMNESLSDRSVSETTAAIPAKHPNSGHTGG